MTSFEEEILKEEVELWKEAREFIRTMSLLHGHSGSIEQAKALCAKLTKTIAGISGNLGDKDDFKFEAEESSEGK